MTTPWTPFIDVRSIGLGDGQFWWYDGTHGKTRLTYQNIIMFVSKAPRKLHTNIEKYKTMTIHLFEEKLVDT